VAAALQTFSLNKHFGGIAATQNVSLNLEIGARHALIGPNGAGKTTLINLLTGVFRPTSGRIELGGSDITGLAPYQRVRRGLVRTFQINQLFAELTPLQSVALAACERLRLGAIWWKVIGRNREVLEESADVLEHLRLADVMNQKTAVLPYGKRRLLEIAIAIASRPAVLLLDEPVAGVPEGEREEILDTLARLPADVTVLLIEHDMDLVFRFANRISVLVNGALFAEGTNEEVARDARVRAVYLGGATRD
jgi:ABC-type branched-subunit amino acid transport system ATPase component